MCNAGGITSKNSENNLVFHLYGNDFFDKPLKNIKKLNNKIKESLGKFKKEDRKPQALIFGGRNNDKYSKDMFTVIDYLFKKNNVDYSAFWGAKGVKSVCYDSEKDTWNVALKKDDFSLKSSFGKKNVCKAFNYIKMSPNDTVNFNRFNLGKNHKNIHKGEIDRNIYAILNKYEIDSKVLEEL